jgi:hypothetical protein
MLTVAAGRVTMKMSKDTEKKRIETRMEVQTYIDRLKYAVQSGSVRVNFQKNRRIDEEREKKYTNRYTLAQLFPNEDEVEALKRELTYLTVEEYLETVKDIRFPNKSEMRVFGKEYSGQDVYIKLRVELVSIAHANGENFILVMSFHFSESGFRESDFLYRKS